MDPENSIKQKVLGELPILTNITPVRGRTSLETHLIDSLNQNQKNALFNCFNQDFTIVQGPPGTGKTRLITHILLMMMNRNKKARILVCGDSNQSVDNLCVAFIELLDELDKNPEFANLQFATNFKDRFVRFSSFHAAALGESNPALKEHLVYLLRPIGTV
jgi:predicted NACHT family NTPase